MPYYGSPLPEDQYDGRDDCYDPRIYHTADWAAPNDYDPGVYRLTSRRFPKGQVVRRYYSLPDSRCQVVELIPADHEAPVTAFAMPSELTLICN